MKFTAQLLRPETRWALFPVVVLGAVVILQLLLVRRVLNDPSFAVENRYYARAMSWDAQRTQDRENARLGWRADVNVIPDGGGSAVVEVRLLDRAGSPLRGAQVGVEAFAIVRSTRILRSLLSESSPGDYRGRLPMNRPGLWELSLAVDRAMEHFTAVVRYDVPSGPER